MRQTARLKLIALALCPGVLCLGVPGLNLAYAQQDPTAIALAIENWLKIETQSLPGQISFEISGLEAANRLAPCSHLDISRPAGAPTWGRTNVLVRCLGKTTWRLHVPVQVRIKTDYLITARSITSGEMITAADLTTLSGDLAELPARTLTDASLAVGKAAATTIPAGRPLRSDMLKAVTVIRQGQTVKVISRGAGFEVANEGRALGLAVAGQVTQVRLGNGRVISGVATSSGDIEVNF